MNLLELLHNENVVRLLEKIDNELTDLTESDNDLSNVFPSIIFMLEMILSKNKVSTVSNDIFMQKEYQDFLKETEIKKLNYEVYLNSSSDNKSDVEKKIAEYLKKEIIKNKKLNYGNI